MGAATSLDESERFLFEYGQLEGRWRAGRAWVHEVVAAAEAEAEATGSITPRTANLVREACRHVNQGGADIARQAYLLAGTRALRDGPLQRAFRDLHAGSQHFFASPSAAIDLARTLLADG
jgi:alkylation response protein AidB-like acyl-CoA dehydrogenase